MQPCAHPFFVLMFISLTLQTATALALTLGVVPESDYDQVVANLAADVMLTNNGHISTGIIGARFAASSRFDPSC